MEYDGESVRRRRVSVRRVVFVFFFEGGVLK